MLRGGRARGAMALAAPFRMPSIASLPGVECVRAARSVLGSARDLLVDVHSVLMLDEGIALLTSLEPLKLYWLEEATPAEPLCDPGARARAGLILRAASQ